MSAPSFSVDPATGCLCREVSNEVELFVPTVKKKKRLITKTDRILVYLKQNPDAGRKQISEDLGITLSTVDAVRQKVNRAKSNGIVTAVE